MKKYYYGFVSADFLKHGTDKAWRCDYAEGYTTFNDSVKWVPRSIMIVEEPNEYGRSRIYIPAWFLTKNSIEYKRIRDVEWGENCQTDYVYI